MLYLDLTLGGALLAAGQPCVGGVNLAASAEGFLMFAPASGVTGSPSWDALGSDWVLLYWASADAAPLQVPLAAVPSQQLSIVLAGQNCILAVYEKDADQSQLNLAPSTAYAEDGYWDPTYSV